MHFRPSRPRQRAEQLSTHFCLVFLLPSCVCVCVFVRVCLWREYDTLRLPCGKSTMLESAICSSEAYVRMCGVSRLAVAVSGGVDSMALASLIHRLACRRRDMHRLCTLHLLTVDHHMRPESTLEAYQVAAAVSQKHFRQGTVGWTQDSDAQDQIVSRSAVLCVQQRLSGSTTASHVPLKDEEAARLARYAALSAYCVPRQIPVLVLAHHAQDQAETVMMRLSRGSGLHGLAGMASVSRHTTMCGSMLLCRPLLAVLSKDHLQQHCLARGVPWFEDETNKDTSTFLRNRIRNDLRRSPILAEVALDIALLARTCSRRVSAAAEQFIGEHVRQRPERVFVVSLVPFAALSEAVAAAVLEWIHRQHIPATARPTVRSAVLHEQRRRLLSLLRFQGQSVAAVQPLDAFNLRFLQ